MNAGALEIVRQLRESGYTTYFAGGFVRDSLLGQEPGDIDIATSASCDEVCALFPRCIQVGAAFGVVQVVMDGKGYEVATFRKEMGYSDGRHPDHIERADAKEDAKRRDFTINGMFFDPVEKEVIDYVGGRADLDQRLLRAIGNPIERMEEDRLRALRAIRFACRFDLAIDPATWEAIERVAGSVSESVSVERIREELGKMAAHESFPRALELLEKSGLLVAIFPEVQGGSWCAERMSALGPKTPLEFKLAGLLMHLDFDARLAFFERFKFSRLAKRRLETLHALESLDFDVAPPHKKARALALFESELAVEALAAHLGDGAFLEQMNAELTRLDFHIDGLRKKEAPLRADDLKPHGIEPGPLLGKLIERAQDVAIDGDIRDKEKLLDMLKEDDLWPSDNEQG